MVRHRVCLYVHSLSTVRKKKVIQLYKLTIYKIRSINLKRALNTSGYPIKLSSHSPQQSIKNVSTHFKSSTQTTPLSSS